MEMMYPFVSFCGWMDRKKKREMGNGKMGNGSMDEPLVNGMMDGIMDETTND